MEEGRDQESSRSEQDSYAQRQGRKWAGWLARQPRAVAVMVGAAGLLALAAVVWLLLA
jgi:hypothetical protein